MRHVFRSAVWAQRLDLGAYEENGMLAVRVVRLIESHGDEIADGVLKKLQCSSRTTDFRNIPPRELRQRILEILQHLSEWLLCKSESEIEQRYQEIGRMRAGQNISFADFCWSLIFTKERIWDFVQQQGYSQGPLEIYGEMELLRLLSQFFERATCYGAKGYEIARSQTRDRVPPPEVVTGRDKRLS
ncbi:MAG TPA: hypothetical protein VIW68_10010 [Candidatus Sulfotelmatobacter sp.]